MSTKAIEALIRDAPCERLAGACVHCGAVDELAAIREAVHWVSVAGIRGWREGTYSEDDEIATCRTLRDIAAERTADKENNG
jgi:hypothetical protein